MNERRQALLRKFQAVAKERVRGVSLALAELAEGRGGAAEAHEIARELHTLKGESNMLGFARVAKVVHAAETLLRESEVPSPSACRRVLAALEVVDDALQGRLAGEDALEAVLAELSASESVPAPPAMPSPAAPAAREAPAARPNKWVQIDAGRVDALCEEVAMFDADFRALATRLDAALAANASGAALRLLAEEMDRCRARLADVTAAAWSLRLSPVEPLLSDLARHAQRLAREQDKRVRVAVDAGGASVERALLDELADPLLHLVQNAVDHGIEAPADRAGKPEEARLVLAAEASGESVVITVADDGRGLDPDALRAAAARRGVATEDAARALSDRDALDLVFSHGFSTRDTVTDLSGRGVGLDVVRRKVASFGGTAALESERGRGARFVLTLPATVSRERALVVDLGGTLYGIACRHIAEVVRVADHLDAPGSIRFRDEILPLRSLAATLGVATCEPEPWAVVLDSAGRRAAFAIPRAAGEHDLLRRPLDRLFARLEYLAASSTLDDGRLVLLLLAAGVLRRHERGAPVDPPRTTAPPSRRRVLVVDDASLVRQVLADLLADAGVEVVTAEDGHAALRAVEAERPDLVVSDLDMPGMNGIELLHALRTAAPDLPVIMLTARSADDVRDRAIREGARAFLVKSDFQPALLIDAVGRCLEKAA